MKPDIRSASLEELEKAILKLKEPKFRSKQIFTRIQQKGARSFDEIIEISRPLREVLGKAFQISTLKKLQEVLDDSGTKKYLWELPDGERIESVLLDDDGRRTICLSTQVGCRMKCAFCATGTIRFKRNLTAGEIVSQVIQIEAEEGPVSNIVYMGMGEPFDNYDEVLKSIRILNHPLGKNIGQRKITVSTCGIPPCINRFAGEKLQVRLAISLNSARDKVRSKLMPINTKYSLDDLMSAIKNYMCLTNRRVTIEYVLIAGQNDSIQDAQALVDLLEDMGAQVNLIPCNPFPESNLKPPDSQTVKAFRKVLESAGFEVVQRYRRGSKIAAACGQLTAKPYPSSSRFSQR